MNYCYFGMSDDDSIVGFKRGSSYILEIYTLILFYFISKKKKKESGICFKTAGKYGGSNRRGCRKKRLASN